MWEYFFQNKDLWILAVFGVAAILATLYYQIYGWRRNDRSFKVSLFATFILGIAGSLVLPHHVPYPPFTWVPLLRGNIPVDCPTRGCLQEHLYLLVTALVGVAIVVVCLVILWGPWWLSRMYWRRAMVIDPAEREGLNKVILTAGFSVDDFDLKLLTQVNDDVRPDMSYVPKKVYYKVTRKTNGRSRNYNTGASSAWPDTFAKDLKVGKFGERRLKSRKRSVG